MNKEQIGFFYEWNSNVINWEMVETILNTWVHKKEFNEMVDKIISDRRDSIMEANVENYEREFDSNPFGVEEHLVGTSGDWEFTDDALDEGYEDARAEILEENAERISEDFIEQMNELGLLVDETFDRYEFLRDLIVQRVKVA